MNNQIPTNEDFGVFGAVARKRSFVAAAEELGVSPAYVSKRIRVLEAQLGTRLLHRTTRRVALTEAGERVLRWTQRVLDDIEQLMQEVGHHKTEPQGMLRVCSSFGFGRQQVAPAIASLVERYPQLSVRLEVFDRLVDVAAEGFDLDIRVGDEAAPHLIARRLANNHRVLCASPAYLARRGVPMHLRDLADHDCLVIKERDHPFGVWKLQGEGQEQVLKVSGSLSSNHGEIALRWALEGRGIVLRSLWEVRPMIEAGALAHLLPAYFQPANIWAVYPTRVERSAKLRVALEFLADWFGRSADPTAQR